MFAKSACDSSEGSLHVEQLYLHCCSFIMVRSRRSPGLALSHGSLRRRRRTRRRVRCRTRAPMLPPGCAGRRRRRQPPDAHRWARREAQGDHKLGRYYRLLEVRHHLCSLAVGCRSHPPKTSVRIHARVQRVVAPVAWAMRTSRVASPKEFHAHGQMPPSEELDAFARTLLSIPGSEKAATAETDVVPSAGAHRYTARTHHSFNASESQDCCVQTCICLPSCVTGLSQTISFLLS